MKTIAVRTQQIKAEFEEEMKVTSFGGLALLVEACRKLGIQAGVQELGQALGNASDGAGLWQILCGLASGGRGLSAGEVIRNDAVLTKLIGLNQRGPEEATYSRLFARMAGLPVRTLADAYAKVVPVAGERKAHRGIQRHMDVEEANPENLKRIRELVEKATLKVLRLTPRSELEYRGWTILFNDGSLQEVRGTKFQSANKDRNGNRSLLLEYIWLGPYVIAATLAGGNEAEASLLLPLQLQARRVVEQLGLKGEKVLSLLDSAYGEREIFESHHQTTWKYIICLNKYRTYLTKLAREPRTWTVNPNPRPDLEFEKYCVFSYRAKSWTKNETVIAIQYKEKNDLEIKYSFLATNLEPADLPSKHTPGSAENPGTGHNSLSYLREVCELYRHKQARENHQKPLLSDLGLHHPASSRFGINQVFTQFTILAANILTAISRAAFRGPEQGIRIWRLRSEFFRIAGKVTYQGGKTIVRLATAIDKAIRQQWLAAMALIMNW